MHRKTNLGISIALGVILALLAVAYVLPAAASDTRPSLIQEQVLAVPRPEPGEGPLDQRSAPYGQYLVTHNSATITTTESLGTVARTAGYDQAKAIFCDVGDYDVTINLYARVSSTGGVYTVSTGTVLPANTKTISNFIQGAPWMSIGATSEVTGSTTTCGIWAQTP